MRKSLLGLALIVSCSFAFAEEYGGKYDGIWFMSTGQYVSIHESYGQMVVIQMDDNLFEGQGREWVAYLGTVERDNAYVATLPDFSDVHSTLDLHFLSGYSLVGYFTSCHGEDTGPDCVHTPPIEVTGERFW